MPEGPIRSAGEYQIELHLHSDVNATIKLQVVAEE
jgi:large subunit ribosomal protein L9